MKALIVGSKGQLGKTLVETAPADLPCTALDLPEIDITRKEDTLALVDAEKPDVIINAAAYTAVDRAEEEAELAYAVNAAGPLHLAEAARESGCRLIHVSTDYVFDGTACTPYPPDAACRPLGIYGDSKRRGEINVLETLETAVILRTSWLYSQYGGNFALTMLRLFKEKPEVGVVADQVGSPTWATTLAEAIWVMARRERLKGVYHWADAGVTSWYDFAVAIQEEALARGIIERTVPIHPITTADYPTPTTRPAYSVLDSTAAWRDLEMNPLQWRVALREMLDRVAGSSMAR